jgi:hypothetical protein
MAEIEKVMRKPEPDVAVEVQWLKISSGKSTVYILKAAMYVNFF